MFLLYPWLVHFITYWSLALYLNKREPEWTNIITNLSNTTINFWFFSYAWFLHFPIPMEGPFFSDLYSLPFIFIIYDIVFYHIHRLFHTAFLARYHALHHTWVEPCSLATLDCSATEYFAINLFPAFYSLYITGVSYWFSVIMSGFFIANAVLVHSSPNILDSFHWKHHTHKVYNFGVLGIMDKLYGTHMK